MKEAFLSAADTARTLLDEPRLGEMWGSDSALARMTVGEVCAHLARAVTVVPGYLGQPAEAPLRDAADYFLALLPHADSDLDSELATSVRRRAASEAALGPAAVISAWDDARHRLEQSLEGDLSRAIGVRGSSMRIYEYLVTRQVELVVHSDDLAASLGVAIPAFQPDVTDRVLGCLLEIAKRRHDPIDMIRAMTRRERADPGALWVF